MNRNGEPKTFEVTLGSVSENRIAKASESNGDGGKNIANDKGVCSVNLQPRSGPALKLELIS